MVHFFVVYIQVHFCLLGQVVERSFFNYEMLLLLLRCLLGKFLIVMYVLETKASFVVDQVTT